MEEKYKREAWWCRPAISSVAMPPSSEHSHSRTSSSTALLPSVLGKAPSGGWRHLFSQSVEKNDPLWKDYIKEAAVFDNRMIDEWNKIIDTVLVYVALFITVLTAFVIETTHQLKPEAANISNQLLLAIYQNQLSARQNTSPHIIDTAALFEEDPAIYGNAIFFNFILFADLALAVIVSVIALFSKLWLINYSTQVNSAGSPYERAMKRQEAYSGALAWRLGTIINALPFLLLLPVFTFGYFIYQASGAYQRFIGYTVGGLFAVGLVFIFLVSTAAAFIPGCPFHTSLSTWMIFVSKAFHKFPFPKWMVGAMNPTRKRYLQALGLILLSVSVLVGTSILVLRISYAFFALIWFPTAATFSFAANPPPSDGRASKYRIPHLLLLGGVIITPLIALACAFIDRQPIFLSLFITASVVFAVIAVYAIRTYKFIPDTGEADAIAWLLKSTSSQDPSLFKNAGRIADKSQHQKALLLNTLLPLLSPLITSQNRHQDEQDLETYVACLAQLSAFADAEGSFWKNESAVVHPPLPDTSLPTILRNLESESSSTPSLRSAARDTLRYYGENTSTVKEEIS